MKNRYFILIIFLFLCGVTLCQANDENNHEIVPEYDPLTGSIQKLSIQGDSLCTNWVLRTDNSQYKWIGAEYGWGLGNLNIVSHGDTTKASWQKPVKQYHEGNRSVWEYKAGGIRIVVTRAKENGILSENYTFINRYDHPVRLTDIGINTPFNDNYPDAETCLKGRVNAHIWAGKNASYIEGLRMSGKAPHLGLLLTHGSLTGYEIKERDLKKGSSNSRGVIVVNPEDKTLKKGERFSIRWTIFSHDGHNDFFRKAQTMGFVQAGTDQYMYQKGETATIFFDSQKPLKGVSVRANGQPVAFTQKGGNVTVKEKLDTLGEVDFEISYNKTQKTYLAVYVISNEKQLLKRRADYIIDHQQYNNPSDPRDGAYLVYDNAKNKIYLNDKPDRSYENWNEGAERLGMGTFLAMQYQQTKDPKIKPSIEKYYHFVRTKLQDPDYTTWSTIEHKGYKRAYYFPRAGLLYFEIYQALKDPQYLLDGYYSVKVFYDTFGHNFYAGGVPMLASLKTLREAGMYDQADTLLAHYRKVGDLYVKNGCNYPRHEVNYEQTIVAPSIMMLLQDYLETKEQKYLDAAKEQMPLLEAFSGRQPHYRLYDIPIRHWDGYWFGKREMWGDTFPHYWSVLTALAYHYYAQSTGDEQYQKRAVNIARSNFCLFSENGQATCAYLFPDRVNGIKARFNDEYANDQDWTFVYYYMIKDR